MVINLRSVGIRSLLALAILAIIVVSDRIDGPINGRVNSFREYLLSSRTDIRDIVTKFNDIRELAPKALAMRRWTNGSHRTAKVEIKRIEEPHQETEPTQPAVPAITEDDDLPRDDVDTKEREGTSSSADEILKPVRGVVSNGFGKRVHPILQILKLHKGIDIAAVEGTPVVASLDGKVYRAGRAGTLGLAVYIEHSGDRHSVYGHLSKISVKAGQWVKRGSEIGQVGKTGLATGSHLHFEYWLGDNPQNPIPLMVQG